MQSPLSTSSLFTKPTASLLHDRFGIFPTRKTRRTFRGHKPNTSRCILQNPSFHPASRWLPHAASVRLSPRLSVTTIEAYNGHLPPATYLFTRKKLHYHLYHVQLNRETRARRDDSRVPRRPHPRSFDRRAPSAGDKVPGRKGNSLLYLRPSSSLHNPHD